MNNQAFQALVNQNRKSTKEIAREAVENEFRKRKRRTRDDREGYGSDSDSDTAEVAPSRQEGFRGEKEGPDWKNRQKAKKHNGKSEYRDRARERREGRNVDYALLDAENKLSAHDDNTTAEERRRIAELSKYLGGDEDHTHLVKGLDRALAQKVKSQEMDGKGQEQLDLLIESACEHNRGRFANGVPSQSGKLKFTDSKSDLGKTMFNYLLREEEKNKSSDLSKGKINPLIHNTIKRSIMTFSLNSDVRRRKNAWDAPRTAITAFSGDHGDDAFLQNSMPLDHHMLLTLTNRFRGYALKTKLGQVLELKNALSSEKAGNEGRKEDADSHKLPNKNVGQAKGSESDDDIFEDVGAYDPPSAVKAEGDGAGAIMLAVSQIRRASISKEAEVSSGNHKKHSIFDNLIQLPNVTSAEKYCTGSAKPRQKLTHQMDHLNKHVISRDLFGISSDCQTFPRRRGQQKAALEGFSMNHYAGGYGEELDVDFGNFDESDGCRKGRKNRNNVGAADSGKDDEENDL